MGTSSFKTYKLVLAGLMTAAFLSHLAIIRAEKDNINAGYGDFLIYYSGAQILNGGNGQNLYNLGMQSIYQSDFHVPYRLGPLPFNHPPYELLLFTRLSDLPYPMANAIWAMANLLLLVLICRILFPFIDARHRTLFSAMLFCFYPTIATLIWGQDSIVSTVLLCGTFASLKQGRDALAGSIAALGLYKPQLVLPSALIFLINCRWRALFAFSVVGLGLVGLSLALVGWNGVEDYISLVSWMNQRHYTIDPGNMANMRGIVETILASQNSTGWVNFVSLLLSIALYLWCVCVWRGVWDPSQPSFELKFAFTTVITLLASYHLYTHDLTLLMVPLMLTFSHVLLGHSTSRIARNLFLSLLLITMIPVAPRILLQHGNLAWAAVPLFLIALALAAEIGSCSDRTRKPEQPS